MREIKFRAWDGKQMHRVCRLGCNGFSTHVWSPSPVACISAFSKNLEIMQYTGLHDKNGKPIYEGDIISLPDPDTRTEVIWKDGSFRILKDSVINQDRARQWEVIGNIYEKSK